MKSKKVKIFIIILIALLVSMYIGVNMYVDSFLNEMDTSEVINEEDLNIYVEEDEEKKADEVVNFLIVGADNLDSGRESSWSEERSDVMKIISLDYTTKKIKITSLDRDVVVYFPLDGYKDYYRFNWAFSYDGSKLCMATINYNLDLDISKYVSMSFMGFISIIDYIDGVDIKLSEKEAREINKQYGTSFSDGVNHLNGKMALSYARLRSIDDDVVRMARQTIVIKAVIAKMKDLDYLTLLSIADDILSYVHTNLTTDEIKKYLLDVLSFDLKDINTISYPEDIYDTDWNDESPMGGYVLKDYEYEATRIHRFIYNDENYRPSINIKTVNNHLHKED